MFSILVIATFNSVGAADIPDEDKSEERKKRDEGKKRYEALEGAEISQMVIDSHDMFFSHFLNQRENDPDFIPVTIPTTPQIRMTRKLVGEYILSNKEDHKYFEDSVGIISDWRKRGPAWEVPYRCLYNKRVKNLAVCGRCVSTNEPMWDVMRVIPCCAVTGQAAGTAAALCEDFSALDISILQNELCRNGVVLHFERK